jgi:tetratricopeptide (TPR) repeat protein
LLDAGHYEEALGLTQYAVALTRALPLKQSLQLILTALGSTYHALQQWEEAHRSLEEAEAVAETLDLEPLLRVPALTRLCMHYAVAGQWEAAYSYALKAIALRKSLDKAWILLDFSRQYETEALLRARDERQAREAVHRLGERLGPYRRFRIVYLRSLATLTAWEGQNEQAIGPLREAAELGLPGERWQIQAALGALYEAAGEPVQARTRLGRRRGSSRGWRRASRMRHCVRAFWLGHRSNRWCSTPNVLPT